MSDSDHRYYSVMLVVSAVVFGVFMCVVSARASDLPPGMTCEDVVRAAGVHNIPNTAWGRVKAKAIALTYGIALTPKEINAAAKCLQQNQADRDYGCTVKQQTPNGECK